MLLSGIQETGWQTFREGGVDGVSTKIVVSEQSSGLTGRNVCTFWDALIILLMKIVVLTEKHVLDNQYEE